MIRKSNINNAGLGLFAVDPMNSNPNKVIFPKGSKIVKYQGEIINTAQLHERYGEQTAPYAVLISTNRYEDAAKMSKFP